MQASEFTLRARSDADLDEIVRWVPDADALARFTGERMSWPLDAEQLRELTASHDLRPFVVVGSAGSLVAQFDLAMSGDTALLGRVIVAPALRGRGLASSVVALAVDAARSLGAVRIRLNVLSANAPAVRAYQRAGFVARPADTTRPGVTVMVLELR